jgi:hypothetical protein
MWEPTDPCRVPLEALVHSPLRYAQSAKLCSTSSAAQRAPGLRWSRGRPRIGVRGSSCSGRQATFLCLDRVPGRRRHGAVRLGQLRARAVAWCLEILAHGVVPGGCNPSDVVRCVPLLRRGEPDPSSRSCSATDPRGVGAEGGDHGAAGWSRRHLTSSTGMTGSQTMRSARGPLRDYDELERNIGQPDRIVLPFSHRLPGHLRSPGRPGVSRSL